MYPPKESRALPANARPSFAVVIGLCSHGLAVARALASCGLPVLALEKDLQIPGVRTRAVQRVHHISDFSARALLAGLMELRAQLPSEAVVVLFPINDNHVRFIGEHLVELEPHFRVSWAASAQLVLQLLDKDALEPFTRARGLNYPPSTVFRAEAGRARSTRSLRFPVIIKPVRPLSSFKAMIARDAGHLDELLDAHQADLPILAQDYIAGDDRSLYFVALLLKDGKAVQSAVGRKLASFPPALGQTTVAETVHDDEATAIAHRFFADTGISGPVSLELKRDGAGRYWVIEPTVGRTDFWAALFVRAGFNLPWMEFQIATGKPVLPAREIAGCIWYDTERAPMAYLGQVWATRSLRPHGKRQAFAYLDGRDWQPFLRACWVGLCKAAQRLVAPRPSASQGRAQSTRALRP